MRHWTDYRWLEGLATVTPKWTNDMLNTVSVVAKRLADLTFLTDLRSR